MFRTRNVLVVVAAAAVIGLGTTALWAGSDKERASKGKEVTLTGRIVDLHGFMTGEYASEDQAKCTQDCIRAGVPAAIETQDGLVVLGQGVKGAAATVAPLGFANAEVKGRLHEKNGVRYLDISSAQPLGK